MGFYDAIRLGASGAADSAFTVDRSLRFNSGDSANLTRTSSSTSTTFTYSVWLKRTKFTGYQYIFSMSGRGFAFHTNNNTFYLYDANALNESSATFRDPSAWYHIVVQINSGVATSYVNNVLTHNAIGSGFTLTTASNATRIGSYSDGDYYFNGYMAEIHLVDGSVVAPSSFAETDATTGQWNPKEYTGSYGTNGFYLNFSDNSGTTATTLGKDSSGNGNNFTPNNFSVSAGTGNDSVEDTPTNNWATFNPLHHRATSTTFSNGNLQATIPTSQSTGKANGNFVVYSGKWYWEVKYTGNTGNYLYVGVSSADFSSYQRGVRGSDGELLPNTGNVSVSFTTNDVIMVALDVDNGKWYIGKNGSYMLSGDPVNGTGFVHSGLVTTYNGLTAFFSNATSSGSQTVNINFGQQGFTYTPPTDFKALNSANLPDPTILLPNKHFDTLLYSGTGSSNSITGLNFAPDWVWGKTRNTTAVHYLFDQVRGVNAYIDTQTDAETTSQTDLLTAFNSNGFTLGANAGSKQVNKNGNTYVAWNWNAGDTDGKTYTVTVVSDSGNKYRFDGFGTSAVTLDLAEGGTYIFNMDDASNATHPFSIGTAANGTVYTSGITYFLDGVSKTYSEYTSGFSGASTRRLHITVPASAPVLYYWCSAHSGMGGQVNTNSTLGSSNFDGSTQSTAKVSASAGFSITAYEGTGSTTTVGHGLGVKPDVMIFKNRDQAHGWLVYHKEIGATKNLGLNTNSAVATASNKFNNTEPTSTVFTVSTAADSNQSGQSIISYCFSEVAGYSKFGSYTGNGSTDGPFVFTGFRPAFLLWKNSSSTRNWHMIDNTRDTFNPVDLQLYPNLTSQEYAETQGYDFLSNGFKIRESANFANNNGGTYIYLAFAESPFKNSRAR